jgi:hypothetical protein
LLVRLARPLPVTSPSSTERRGHLPS